MGEAPNKQARVTFAIVKKGSRDGKNVVFPLLAKTVTLAFGHVFGAGAMLVVTALEVLF